MSEMKYIKGGSITCEPPQPYSTCDGSTPSYVQCQIESMGGFVGYHQGSCAIGTTIYECCTGPEIVFRDCHNSQNYFSCPGTHNICSQNYISTR